MTLTKTIHPPAGATALLAAVDPQVEQLGWYLLPLVALSSAVTLGMSLLINNIQRQYPMYWWTPADLGKDDNTDDIEKVVSYPKPSQDTFGTGRSYLEDEESTIKITRYRIVVPDGMCLAQEERSILEILQDRLREGLPQLPNPAARR